MNGNSGFFGSIFLAWNPSSVKFSDHYKFEKIKYHFRHPILKISGVSLELIFFFQNFKNHRTREIACWCEWVFLNLSNRNIEIINNPLIPLKWHDIIDGFSFIDKMQRVPWICITYIHLYCVYILYLQYIYIRK